MNLLRSTLRGTTVVVVVAVRAGVALLVTTVPAIASPTVLAAPPPDLPPNLPASAITGDIPMADYLALLAQVAPAAQQGALTYLSAFQRRCGRALPTTDLRRAMSGGNGDPVLMAMIRASHLRDGPGLDQLRTQVRCHRQPRP